ncbi:MAG TPA: glycine--tRNA ligase subunit beta [Phototrophicaceae bacterium]|jgi:glycyl-tRNA synthetase|nr:glycine--tRNA ligase subunit beta [Phototrophicaceae bacterium]
MTKRPLSFQQAILKLHEFWAEQGCVIWEPYNVQVGAGTGNPATLLRVLGPEPWRVAYVEPSVRPDDGRYGENPNRMQKYYQYQVILKPDPGNPQELYLKSLEAIGINPREHDIRFVEDNWESPALGAWGLGWEVWLDGQEITQFTYFQQAGGLELNPVSVEITYGVERIILALQNKNSAWEIDWMGEGLLEYRDLFYQEEIEYCRYYFDVADVDALKRVYDTYEREYGRALEGDALIAAYDYVLKCSHMFNVLDTRGAIGVTERASYFRRMRDMTRTVAKVYAEQRATLNYPLLKLSQKWAGPTSGEAAPLPIAPTAPADVLVEIGVEELPAQDVDDAITQVETLAVALFDELRLAHQGLEVTCTPRRIVILAKQVAPVQPDLETIEKGPPASRAFDADGKPTKAAEGFAKSRGLNVSDLTVTEVDGGQYVMAKVLRLGRPATEVLAEKLPGLIGAIKFGKSMRWNSTNIAFSRPLRWIVALFGDCVIPFVYAGVASGNVTRGLRPYGSPEQTVHSAAEYTAFLKTQGIVLDLAARRELILSQIAEIAAKQGGHVPEDAGLLAEVINLVEAPTALLGKFEPEYLSLPRDVLVTVMRDKQRYFPMEDADGNLMPCFITVRNGDAEHLDMVAYGNEHVLRARFSDASFFYKSDVQKRLEDYLPRLNTLTFEEHLGSMLDKTQRIAKLSPAIGDLLKFSANDIKIATQAGNLAKADLATNMVVEMTSLQGTMGREYALLNGYSPEVARAIFEHWLPRGANDQLPATLAGTLLAITDRLDSLVGLFAVGLAPKSTTDPYGLRRAALGIIQIVLDKYLDFDLIAAVKLTAGNQPVPVEAIAQAQVLEFISGRLRVWLQEQGWAVDVINAVLAAQESNPYRALVGIQQLSEWVKREDWFPILDGFARCVRITRTETSRYPVDPALFRQPEEGALYEAYQRVIKQPGVTDDINGFLSAFAPMVPTISKYFGERPGEGVLVNTEDPAIRRNRIGLLQAISAMQHKLADLSYLSGF